MNVDKQQYQSWVEEVSPQTNLGWGCLKAFLVGGLICVLGQCIHDYVLGLAGMTEKTAAAWTSISLIFLGAFVTGVGWYDNIGHFAGAGSIIPITGFANSVCSPAMEFKTEGYVYGMAAKMFIVAGPIIVFGVLAGALVGILYLFL